MKPGTGVEHGLGHGFWLRHGYGLRLRHGCKPTFRLKHGYNLKHGSRHRKWNWGCSRRWLPVLFGWSTWLFVLPVTLTMMWFDRIYVLFALIWSLLSVRGHVAASFCIRLINFSDSVLDFLAQRQRRCYYIRMWPFSLIWNISTGALIGLSTMIPPNQ